VWFIIGLLVFGLIVGALGRLAIPGPNPMSILMTIGIGIGGALIGGLVGAFLFDRATGFILSVPAAAFLVWWVERSRTATIDR
jgi:uncharacterized membrane protein YeaQ/YmgE (transglycosylase-associated protein family)